MQNKKTLSLLAIIAGIALVVAYWEQIKAQFARLTSKPGAAQPTTATPVYNPSSATQTAPNAKEVSYQQILKRGSRGESVKMLQTLLNGGWQTGLSVDGIFGNKTEAALHTVTGKYSITLTEMVNRFVNPNPLALGILNALK